VRFVHQSIKQTLPSLAAEPRQQRILVIAVAIKAPEGNNHNFWS